MADDAGYVLSEFDANWVVNNAGQKERDRIETVRRIGPQCVLCKNGGTEIAARAGSTLSSQSCTVYKATGGTLDSLSRTITVYNLSTTAVAADAYIIALLVGDTYLAGWEDC